MKKHMYHSISVSFMYNDSWDHDHCYSDKIYFDTMEEANEFIERMKNDEDKDIHQMFITESKQII